MSEVNQSQRDIINRLNGLRTDSNRIREEIERMNNVQTRANQEQSNHNNRQEQRERTRTSEERQERRRRTRREDDASRSRHTNTRLSEQMLNSGVRSLEELREQTRQNEQQNRRNRRNYRRDRDYNRRRDRREDRDQRRERNDERDRHDEQGEWFRNLREDLTDIYNTMNISNIKDNVSGDINSAGDMLRDLSNSMGNNTEANKALHESFNASIKNSGAGTSRQDYAELYTTLYEDLGIKELKDIEKLAPAFDVLTNTLGVSADATEKLTKNFKDPKVFKSLIGSINKATNYSTDTDALTELASTYSALNKNVDHKQLEAINKNIVGTFSGLQNQGIDTSSLEEMFLDASRMSQGEYVQSHGGYASQYYQAFKSGNTDALLNFVQQAKNSPLQMAENYGLSQEDMTMIKNANMDEILKVSKDVAGGTYDEALKRQEDMQVGVFDRFGNWLSKTWIGSVMDEIQANTNLGLGDVFAGITAFGTIHDFATKYGWLEKFTGTRAGGAIARGLGRAKGGLGRVGSRALGGLRGVGGRALGGLRGVGSRALGTLTGGAGISGIGSTITGGLASLGGGSALVGGAGVLGGLGGLAGLWSAGKNFYKAFTSDDKEEADKQATRGGTKLGMVGGGALAGATIGSAIPVVGTAIGGLVGAGVGGLGAIFSGDAVGDWIGGLNDKIDTFIGGLGSKLKEGITALTESDWVGKAFETMGSIALSGFLGIFGGVGNIFKSIFGGKTDSKSAIAKKASEKTQKRKKSKSSFDLFDPSTWFDGSHKDGLDRVPFDGYKAILHKDETVLTRKEADQYRIDKNAKQSTKLSSKLMGMSQEASKTYKDFYDKLQATNAGATGTGDSASSDGGDLNLAPGSSTTAKQAFPTKDNEKFIKVIGKLAQRTARQSGILPSTTIAQAIEESGWGMSGLTQQANALFGIKAGSSWKGNVWTGKTLEYNSGGGSYGIKAGFRAYNSIEESIIDHDKLLNKPTYTRFNVPHITDPLKQVQAIKQSGYATNPTYVNDVYRHVRNHDLSKYNKYEQGTPFVPDTQVALLHKGEMVVPAKHNPNNMRTTKVPSKENTNQEILELIKVVKSGFDYVVNAIKEGKEIKLPARKPNPLNQRFKEYVR